MRLHTLRPEELGELAQEIITAADGIFKKGLAIEENSMPLLADYGLMLLEIQHNIDAAQETWEKVLTQAVPLEEEL